MVLVSLVVLCICHIRPVSMVDPTINYRSSGKFGPRVLYNAIGKFIGWEEMRAKFDASDMHALRCVEMMAEMQKAHWIGIESHRKERPYSILAVYRCRHS